MSNFLGFVFAATLIIVAIRLWSKESEVRGWDKGTTTHKYRFVSVVFVVAALTMIYTIVFKE